MPKRVQVSAEAFTRFREYMEGRKFREISREESSRDFWRLKLTPPSPREGREVGFTLHANGLTAVVWTSYLLPEERLREKDYGWVLIREGDKARYFAHPMLRTKHFLGRMYRRAVVAQLRILNRPLCPVCRANMRIARGKGLKSRFWECRKVIRHPDKKPIFVDWDYELSLEKYPKALAFVLAERKKRKRYRDRARAAGKRVGKAMMRREGWQVGRPENLIPT